jgi:hypothetical protein
MQDYMGKELHQSVDYALIGHVMNTVPIRLVRMRIVIISKELHHARIGREIIGY